jgi:hypothetical protein
MKPEVKKDAHLSAFGIVFSQNRSGDEGSLADQPAAAAIHI